jgi:hypothetical protein
MFVCCVCMLCLYVVFCVGRGLWEGLITRAEESYRVSVCVWSGYPEREGKGPSWTIRACEWMKVHVMILKDLILWRVFLAKH